MYECISFNFTLVVLEPTALWTATSGGRQAKTFLWLRTMRGDFRKDAAADKTTREKDNETETDVSEGESQSAPQSPKPTA